MPKCANREYINMYFFLAKLTYSLWILLYSPILSAQVSHGEALFYQRKFSEAANYFEAKRKKALPNTDYQATFWLAQSLYSLREIDSAMDIYCRLIDDKLAPPEWRVNALGGIVAHYSSKKDMQIAKHYVSRLEREARAFPQLRNTRYWRVIGTYHFYGLKNDEAISCFVRSAREAEKEKDNLGLAGAYVMLGRVYQRLEKDSNTRSYYEKAIKLQENQGVILHLPQCYQALALLYESQNEYKKAIEYYKKGIELDTKLGDEYGKAYGLMGLADINLMIGNTTIDLSMIEEAYAIFKKYEDKHGMSYCLFMKGKHYQANQDYDRALTMYKQSNSLLLAIGYLKGMNQNYEKMIECEVFKNNYELAFQYLKRNQSIKDSLSLIENKQATEELAIRYETEKKDAELARKELELLGRKQQLTQIALGAVLVILLFVGLFVGYRWNQRRKIQRLESEFEQAAQQLKSFNYSVSHDLRLQIQTAQRALNTITQLLPDGSNEQLHSQLRKSKKSLLQMNMIIEGLLELTAIEHNPLRMTSVNTKILIEDVLEELQPQATVLFNELPIVQADNRLIRLVFTNLLSNALKYTALQTVPTIRISAELLSDVVLFQIEDNGLGFKEEFSARLFQVFGRLHSEVEGIGIGLVIVKKVVEKHGGKVGASGKEGQGATFWFQLPR